MSLIERTIKLSFQQRVYFTRGVFDPANTLLQEVLANAETAQPVKALLLLDESLHLAQPALRPKIEAYFARRPEFLRLACNPIILEGGERLKNSYFHVSEIQSHIDRYHIDRHSYVLAVGGGALLDVVGLGGAT